MRDIFEDIFKGEPLDPVELARRSVRRTLRKRFYESAGVVEDEWRLRGHARRQTGAHAGAAFTGGSNARTGDGHRRLNGMPRPR